MKCHSEKSKSGMNKRQNRICFYLITLELVSAILLAFFIWFVTGDRVKEDVAVQDLENAVLDVLLSDEVYWQKADYEKLREYYGLNANDYEGFCLYVPASNMDAAELLIVKLSDEGQAETVQEAIEKRLENQKGKFEAYGVEQMGILNHAVVIIKEPYILFAVCGESEDLKEAFLNMVRK